MTSQLVLRLQLYPSECRLGTTLGVKGSLNLDPFLVELINVLR